MAWRVGRLMSHQRIRGLARLNSPDPEMDPAFAGSIKGVGGWDLLKLFFYWRSFYRLERKCAFGFGAAGGSQGREVSSWRRFGTLGE